MFWWGALIAFVLIIALVWLGGAVDGRLPKDHDGHRRAGPLIPGLHDDDPFHH